MPHTREDYTKHLHIAEAKARALAIDAYPIVEGLAGWAHVAQLDSTILEAALEARAAVRRVRNLLLPDEVFPDEVRAPRHPTLRETRTNPGATEREHLEGLREEPIEHPGTGVEMQAIEVGLGEIGELKGDSPTEDF